MSKSYLPLLVFVTLSFSASAQSIGIKGHRLSLGTSLGFLAGEGEEIVYRDENSDDKLSQLLWEIKPLFYAGLELNYNWHKPGNRIGFFTGALFKYGFSAETGVMEDRDWLDSKYSDFLTHYSVHDNKTENAILFDANIGISFRIFEKYLLKTYIVYNLMRFSWTAKGGSILHPSTDTDNDGQADYSHIYYTSQIDVITYEQTFHILSPAIAFYGEFNQFFDIEISLKLSPWVRVFAQDVHIGSFTTTENPIQGLFFEPSLIFSFKPHKIFALSFSVAYKNISGTRGDSEYSYENGSKEIYEDSIGAGYSAFDVGIMAKFNIIK